MNKLNCTFLIHLSGQPFHPYHRVDIIATRVCLTKNIQYIVSQKYTSWISMHTDTQFLSKKNPQYTFELQMLWKAEIIICLKLYKSSNQHNHSDFNEYLNSRH